MHDFMKTIISALQSWVTGKIKESAADWNQNDSSANSYVKNRTHWEEDKKTVLVNNLSSADYEAGNTPACNFIPDMRYDVVWNGVLYENLICNFDGEYNVIGNPDELPFYIDDDGGDNLYIEGSDNWVVSISTTETVVHKLDTKYLNLPTNLATTDDVQEALDAAHDAMGQTEYKMDKENPVGTGSFSMNRKSGTTVGDYSHAEGFSTTASGSNSHAEGRYTTASGDSSHAEGNNTIASGNNSHAEGTGTIAGRCVHNVIGQYNIEDTAYRYTDTYKPVVGQVSSNKKRYYCGDYVHIVGNGTSNNARSNAHTLDWDGNAWYQGDVYVGGTGQDDATARLLKTSETATEDDVLDALSEMSYIDPITAQDGSIYTNKNGEIYIL